MKRVFYNLISFALITALFLSSLCVGASAAKAKYADAYPLPKLTGNLRTDIVAVAKSQLGYKEASDKSSVFGAWNGDPYQDWCSEFTAWCEEKAGVPVFAYPKLDWVVAIRDFFAPKGRCYHLKEGASLKNYDFLGDYKNVKTLSMSELLPGDIIITGFDDPTVEPNHTAIFLSVTNGKIETISGNFNDCVMTYADDPRYVHAVVRPDYELEETKLTKDLSEITTRGSKWSDYTGKKVYPDFYLYDEEIRYRLEKNKDYKIINVKNAVNPGSEATATFTGIGNYTGKVEVKYNIWLADPVLKVKKGSTKVKLVWDAVKGAQRYSLWRSEDGGKTFKEILHLDKDRTSCVIKYDRNKSVTYQLRAYYQRDKGWWIYSRSENVTVGKK